MENDGIHPYRCKEWVRLSGNKKLLEITSADLCKRAHLCALHFEGSQFANNKKNSLIRGCIVIPKLFNNEPLTPEDMQKYPVTVWRPVELGKQKDHNQCDRY